MDKKLLGIVGSFPGYTGGINFAYDGENNRYMAGGGIHVLEFAGHDTIYYSKDGKRTYCIKYVLP